MSQTTIDIVNKNLAKRYAREKRFRLLGFGSVMIGFAALVFLLVTIVGDGWGAFKQSSVRLQLNFDQSVLSIEDVADEEQWQYGNYIGVIKAALRERFPEMTSRAQKKLIFYLFTGVPFQKTCVAK